MRLIWKHDKPQVLFFDFDEDYITVDIKGDALLSVAVLPMMAEYNGKLLKRFYQ